MNAAPADARTRRLPSGPFAVVLLALIAAAPDAGFAVPRVVVTVKPLHSLVAGVMAGLGEPDLIIRGGGSPHTYGLKPSEARLLERAQVIFWIGPSLERFMLQPLAALGSKARVEAVGRMPGITLLPGRAGGVWDEPAGPPGDRHDREAGEVASRSGMQGAEMHDGHLWLDPANARVIARAAADVLGRVDPGNRAQYVANAGAVIARIAALDAELNLELASVREVPFVVFHDAYQYFEKRYALRAAGSITVSAERKPGARRVRQIRDTIGRRGARCVFSEPQFSPAILVTLLEGTSVRTGILDPLGAELPAGPDAYFTLMRNLGAALVDCLRTR
jgi:zinc transport system substrate-binding protein